MIIRGDSSQELKNLKDNSVDACVTDPPYGLSFMGKKWDYDVPSVELWREVLRVLKPGGHLLSFGGTRTYHRMVVNIEDADFEVRDQIMWLYGSGFPKSHDVSKAIDKAAGAEREVVGLGNDKGRARHFDSEEETKPTFITAPATDDAKRWQGWGTALKPANEPIVLARKPIERGLTVAENVLKWGTGAINVDGCRIGVSERDPNHRKPSLDWQTAGDPSVTHFGSGGRPIENLNAQGRWPANVLFDEDAARVLDEQTKDQRASKPSKTGSAFKKDNLTSYEGSGEIQSSYNDSGGASRFFYVAKTSKRERNAGLEGVVKQKQGNRPNSADASGKFPDHDHRPTGGNNHPTVKPIKLMEYLCKLITPPKGVILDPFMGSGSTGCAAVRLGFNFIGIEREAEYVEIAKKRIEHWTPKQMSLD